MAYAFPAFAACGNLQTLGNVTSLERRINSSARGVGGNDFIMSKYAGLRRAQWRTTRMRRSTRRSATLFAVSRLNEAAAVADAPSSREESSRIIAGIEDISYKIGSVQVLSDVTLELRENEIVCLLGPSGSGKSTLLRMLAGLTQPSSGVVTTARRTAVVFQSFALFPWLTVLENVALGLHALLPDDPNAATKRAIHVIDTIGLDGYENAYPRELSGGMRQRVGFARALAVQPELLCLDEPFSALDVLTAENLRSELLRLWTAKELPTKAILLVTHGIEEAVSLADRIVVLGRNPGHIRTELVLEREALPHPRERKSAQFETLVDFVYALISNPARQVAPVTSAFELLHAAVSSGEDDRGAAEQSAEVFDADESGEDGTAPTLGSRLDGAFASEPLESREVGVIVSEDGALVAAAQQESRRLERYPVLPAVRIGSVGGLLVFLDEDLEDAEDLASLGQNLQLDVDDLMPLVDTAELLGLVRREQEEDGSILVRLCKRGRSYLAANIDQRKAIVRESVLARAHGEGETRLIGHILRMLRRAKRSRVPQELIFDTVLLKHFSPREARSQLEIAVEWGRFMELFGYDAPTGEIFLDENELVSQPLDFATTASDEREERENSEERKGELSSLSNEDQDVDSSATLLAGKPNMSHDSDEPGESKPGDGTRVA